MFVTVTLYKNNKVNSESNTVTAGTELVTADSNSVPRILSLCLKFKVRAKVSDPAVTNSKMDENRGKRCLQSRTLFLRFSKITGSESAVYRVFTQ